MSRDIYPLDAPGLPLPGQCFYRLAASKGDQFELKGKNATAKLTGTGEQLQCLVEECLYGRGTVILPVPIKGREPAPMRIVPGHRWGVGDEESFGPEPCEVMIVGKMLGEDEANRRRQFIGKSGQHFLGTLRKLGIEGMHRWYVTNVLKCEHPKGESGGAIGSFVTEFKHLLQQELRLVKPKYVLCLAADALKAIMDDNDWTLHKAEGRILEKTIDTRRHLGDPPAPHTFYVMSCIHPAAALSEPRHQPRMERTLTRFDAMIQGIRWDQGEPDIDHRVVRTEEELQEALQLADKELAFDRMVAVDAEWHKQHPEIEGSYLRCVQFSWREKKAVVVPLTEAGGRPLWPKVKHKGKMVSKAIALLDVWFQDKRVCGLFFNSDLEWLVPNGLDLRRQFAAPQRWQDCELQGGWDVANMAHSANETDELEMNAQLRTYTTIPRYDVRLDEWKRREAARLGINVSDLDGFGECPDEVLYPYAAYDADGTYRLCRVHQKRLSCDEFGNDCWKGFWMKQRAIPAALEMTRVGLRLNNQRVDELTGIFMTARNELKQRIRDKFNWPDLNLESHEQVRELLFGEKLNGTTKGRLRPPGAKSLYCMPTITTGKRPKAWTEVVEKHQEAEHTPSTNKTALGILFRESDSMLVWRKDRWVQQNFGEQVGWLRDYRFVNQVLKSSLRPPVWDESGSAYKQDEDGNWLYEKGLAGCICDDHRVRTFLSLYMETCRWSSSRPPLQNLSKRRDAEYARILGDKYRFSIRSIFEADPGYVLIEADISGAELLAMGILSGDQQLLDHARRGCLPEHHPDYYDIHSNIAVLAFKLSCPPTKAGLGKEFKHLRIVAKSVIFGCAYGRGAKAIALAIREDGVQITEEEAQAVIDTIFALYPGLVSLFAECRNRATGGDDGLENPPRWLGSDYGAYRRAPVIDPKERKLRGDIEREFMNWPIQHMVAGVVNTAVHNFRMYRAKHKLHFKMALQIHDALLFLVPLAEVEKFVTDALPTCMTKQAPIYRCTLDGVRVPGEKPYFMGFDYDIYHYWGETLYPDELLSRKVDPSLAHWHFDAKLGGYVHRESPDKVWIDGRTCKKEELTHALAS